MTAEFVCTPCRLRKLGSHGCRDRACTCCYGAPMKPLLIAMWGDFHATRLKGEAMRRAALEVASKELGDGDPLELDFAGVTMVAGGWADEFLATLVQVAGREVRVLNVDDEIRETLELALSRRGLTAEMPKSPAGHAHEGE